MNADRCVMCGDIITEGRMICERCERAETPLETVKIRVSLDRVADLAGFVKMASKCSGDVVVTSGKFSANGKSLMSLFSLDLTKPVTVEFHGDIPSDVVKEMRGFSLVEWE